MNWLQQLVPGSGEGLFSYLRLQSKSRHVSEGQVKNLSSIRTMKEERSVKKTHGLMFSTCFPHVFHPFLYFMNISPR